MKKKYFITGIDTGVGKTIAAAIVTEALQADYWKPIQAGDLNNSDTKTVKRLVSNDTSRFHENAYALENAMSPHAAANLEKIKIEVAKIEEPKTENSLVIEGAGGLMVPLNDKDCLVDLIKPEYGVILVSRNYLGSINHTLLAAEALKNRNLNCIGIIFSGEENKASEEVILQMSGLALLGRIEQEPYFDRNVILEYAEIFRSKLD